MNIDLDEYDLNEIKNGYTYDPLTKVYRCMHCGALFEEGEIFPIEGRFYEAFRAVGIHMEREHRNRFQQLIESGNKYNTLTEKQRELLTMIREGMTDQSIAAKLGISASTVRHQKFSFREKAKQAKLYLAIYELSTEKSSPDSDNLIPIHESANMVDDRFVITKEERDKILSTVFESLSPLKLKIFSAKEKKKIVILQKVIEQFEKGRIYTEKEVNATLKEIYGDYPTMRRYLIEYGFMSRSRDCKEYWIS